MICAGPRRPFKTQQQKVGYATGSGLYPFTDFLFPENKSVFEANRCLISKGKRVDQTLEWNMPPPTAEVGDFVFSKRFFLVRRR